MMGLGAYRQDRMQKITGGFWDFSFQDLTSGASNGAFYMNPDFPSAKTSPSSISVSTDKGDGYFFDSSRVTRTGQHTEPENTALNGFIIVK